MCIYIYVEHLDMAMLRASQGETSDVNKFAFKSSLHFGLYSHFIWGLARHIYIYIILVDDERLEKKGPIQRVKQTISLCDRFREKLHAKHAGLYTCLLKTKLLLQTIYIDKSVKKSDWLEFQKQRQILESNLKQMSDRRHRIEKLVLSVESQC